MDSRRFGIKWVALSALVGVLAGVSAAAFLWLLDLSTRYRLQHPGVISALPLAGLAIGWAYHRYGRGAEKGNHLILEEIHDPKRVLPLRMAPLVFLGTCLTHLFGGSAGREGTAVQMGASLADQLSGPFKVSNGERRILLMAGMGAGFGAAIGAPLAGAIFGMEVIYVNRLKLQAVVECLVASFIGFWTSVVLRAPHSMYPGVEGLQWSAGVLLSVVLVGAASGISAALFIRGVHVVEGAYRKLGITLWLRPVLGGVLLVALYQWLSPERYAGLGISVIQDALRAPATFSDPPIKALLTALTVGSGFKGGEFIPLVFIGTTLGSAASLVLAGSVSLLGALGFAAVFAGASNTPVACAVMAGELFGARIVPYALVACGVSYLFSGARGIYGAQKAQGGKLGKPGRYLYGR